MWLSKRFRYVMCLHQMCVLTTRGMKDYFQNLSLPKRQSSVKVVTWRTDYQGGHVAYGLSEKAIEG